MPEAGLSGDGLHESVTLLRSEPLAAAFPELNHGFTFGLPRLDDAGIARETIAYLGGTSRPTWVFAQPHGADILNVVEGEKIPSSPKVPVIGFDGGRGWLFRHGMSLVGPTFSIKAADCVTVLAVHPQQRAYAALHAGWKGTAAGILPRLLGAWRQEGGTLDDVRIALGPHIRSCCFEVKADCLAQFRREDVDGAIVSRGGATYLDLEWILRRQAASFGVTSDRVDSLPYCTRCYRSGNVHPFASYRRAQAQGERAGRNLAFIGPVA
jgi:copper oxidase (laccase) domain-containing protein